MPNDKTEQINNFAHLVFFGSFAVLVGVLGTCLVYLVLFGLLDVLVGVLGFCVAYFGILGILVGVLVSLNLDIGILVNKLSWKQSS